MIRHIQHGLKKTDFMSEVCRLFEVPRRIVCYKPDKSTPKAQERFAEPVPMRWPPHHRPVSAGAVRVHSNFTNMGRGKDEHLDSRY
jgi:hypothetical protein